MLCRVIPLIFTALHKYEPNWSLLFGLIDNVLLLCVELTPLKIDRPSLYQVKVAAGFASTTHFNVTACPNQDFTTFEDVMLSI